MHKALFSHKENVKGNAFESDLHVSYTYHLLLCYGGSVLFLHLWYLSSSELLRCLSVEEVTVKYDTKLLSIYVELLVKRHLRYFSVSKGKNIILWK